MISTGQRVRIVRGALTGVEGILVRKKGISRLVLCVSLIMRAVAIEVDEIDVEPIQHSPSMHISTRESAMKELAAQWV